jgi:hypothetical protein
MGIFLSPSCSEKSSYSSILSKLISTKSTEVYVSFLRRISFVFSILFDICFEEIRILSCPYRKAEKTKRKPNIKKQCLILNIVNNTNIIIFLMVTSILTESSSWNPLPALPL